MSGGVRVLVVAAAVVVAAAGAAGCSRLGVSVPQSALLKYVERKSGSIAVAGTDGNVALMDQAGGEVRALTADGRAHTEESDGATTPFAYYQLPVWSPDGARIACVLVRGAGQEVEEYAVVVLPAKGGKAVTVYASALHAPSLVAWSPDSTRLVFLAGNGFYLVPAAGGDPLLLDAGAPYAWAWSPRGQELLIHAGSAAGGLASDRLAFLDVEEEILEEGLGLVAGVFDAPAWSPDGRHVLVATWEEETNRLTLTNRKRTESTVIAQSDGPLTFGFSPSGRDVAYVDGSTGLRVAAVPSPGVASTQGKSLSGEDVVAAFFWSPDSSRIGYFVPGLVELPAEAEGGAGAAAGASHVVVLTLKVVEVRGGAAREVATFLPTPGFLGLVQQFAQVSQALRIWSPDSRHLVYAAVDAEGPGIMVAMAAESIAPRRIASGLDASWSRK